MDFELDKDEQIVAIFRRHIFSIVHILFSTAFLVVAAVAAFYFLGRYPTAVGAVIPVALLSLVLLLVIVVASAILLVSLYINSRNRVIVTNKHVLQVAQESLLNHSVSHLTLDRVQDVQGSRSGLWATLFNFGELEVESAGADKNFIFQYCPHPNRCAQTIIDTHEKYFHGQPGHTHIEP